MNLQARLCKSNPNNNIKNNPCINKKTNQEIYHFIAEPGTECKREVSAETMSKTQNECSDVFTANGCLKGTFSLHVKDDVKPHQVSLKHIANTHQEPFRNKSGRLQEQQITCTTRDG